MLRADNATEAEHELQARPSGSSAFGKYQLFASLGKGGMADVFLAVARGPMGFNKLVVVKRLRAALAEEASFLNMFLDEARLAARLNHSNVVHTYEVGEHNGSYFIAMEYLEGQSLNKVIKEATKQGQNPSIPVLARIVADALSGLHHAHELRDYDGRPLNIIHRDVSPHNVFVTYDGQVKLVDFGIAKAALSSTQTEVGVLKGKVAYMAPEQAMGAAIDRRADIFAMGIVLWELVTRKRLMTGDSAAATLHRLLSSPIPLASSVVEGLDPGLDAIIAKALEKNPDLRYSTAVEMREALEGYVARSGVTVRQEDVGKLVGALFQNTREEVQRQIQSHMSAVGNASSTQELAALTLDSLRKFDASASNPSHRLMTLGDGSGSGSGVISNPTPGMGQQGGTLLSGPQPQSKQRVALIGIIAVLLLLGVGGIAFVLGSKQNEPHASAAGTPTDTAKVADPAKADPALATAAAGAQVATGAGAAGVAPGAGSSLAASTGAAGALATSSATATPSSAVAAAAQPVHGGGSRPGSRSAPAAPRAPAAPTPATNKPPVAAVEPAAPAKDEGHGFLTLDTYPWTKVSEGGKVLGTTPLIKFQLPAGAHTLTLENGEQGVKQSTTVVIKANESISKRLAFK